MNDLSPVASAIPLPTQSMLPSMSEYCIGVPKVAAPAQTLDPANMGDEVKSAPGIFGQELAFSLPGQLVQPEVHRFLVQMPCLQPASYFRWKSCIDLSLALLVTVAALPVIFLVSLAVIVFQGRPVFYRQNRVGKGGRLFRIWKFRTMRTDAEVLSGAVWSTRGDPRVTKLGRLLRCSHLDELPQLLNVLRGDMDLVGPRPERPEFVMELSAELPCYSQRLLVRPGITGLAQLKLGYDVSIADVEKKVILDLEYIRSASFLKDIRLLLQTIPYIFRQIWNRWCAYRATQREARQQVSSAEAENRILVTEMIAARQLRHARLDDGKPTYKGALHLRNTSATLPSAVMIDRV